MISSLNRVNFSVGRLTEEAYRAHQVALTIQQEVENATRPGSRIWAPRRISYSAKAPLSSEG